MLFSLMIDKIENGRHFHFHLISDIRPTNYFSGTQM